MSDGTGRTPELLIPAGSLPLLKIAVLYGADAVYIGGEAFSLRSKAVNFRLEEMREGIAFAHLHHVKVYVTANILAHNDDIAEAESYFRQLGELKPDAVLIADPGMFAAARETCPDIPVHISTQANNVNYRTFLFWYGLGVKRVVCGRELSLREIREIRDRIPADMEIETFVHGAMCISYSGRCLLSNYLTGRDANKGECTHPCRWKYAVVEETRPGEYMPVEENERGTYIFNSRDLCMIGHLPDLIEAGADSLKVEGRMKTALYVATVARTYRIALDDLRRDPALYAQRLPWYMEQIEACTYRPFTTGFFYGKPGASEQIYDSNTYVKGYTYLGYVESAEEGWLHLTQKNKFSVGEQIEIMKPDGTNLPVTVCEIRDTDGNEMQSAPHSKQQLRIRLCDASGASPACEAYDILRRKEE